MNIVKTNDGLTQEVNFDGLIGPTHNYGGLSEGNLASAKNEGLIARPREAALQGLDKMWAMREMGLVQGILPPHARPHLATLRQLGLSGTDVDVLTKAAQTMPYVLRNIYSASPMWAANAATISPSADCGDGKLHMSTANLSTMFHRSLEAEQTTKSLKAAFAGDCFVVTGALPQHSDFSDEGAANHVRLCADHGRAGVEVFVYGRDARAVKKPHEFPARQTLQASQAIARRHDLNPQKTVYIQQSAQAINAGAFHNDVVCVGAKQCLFFHEYAFDDTKAALADIRRAAAVGNDGFEPQFVEVKNADVPIEEAIKAYLFNAMLVQIPDRERLTLIAPLETKNNAYTKAYCDQMVAGNSPIGEVVYVDVRQSMRNGGGPACLRLRVVLTPQELAQTNPHMILNPTNYLLLQNWIKAHYRETLHPDELANPNLMQESFTALDELSGILNLGDGFYPFQK